MLYYNKAFSYLVGWTQNDSRVILGIRHFIKPICALFSLTLSDSYRDYVYSDFKCFNFNFFVYEPFHIVVLLCAKSDFFEPPR